MRIVTNDKKIKRNKQIAQGLFFASMALLIGAFFFGNSNDNPDVSFYLQCGLLPVLLLMVLTSVRMTNSWVRQPYPWEAIPAGLKGIGGDTTLYNFVLPGNHVMIGPNGIFSITSRFQDRPQTVKDDKWRSNFGILTLMRQEQIGNPTHEAKLKAEQTAEFLREVIGDEGIQVQPLVVFVHPQADVSVDGETSVPILYANPEKKKMSLKQYLKDAQKQEFPTLTKEQQAELDDTLLYSDA